MLKQKSKLILSAAIFSAIAFIGCNSGESDKAAETPAADTATKMETTTEQKVDTAAKAVDTAAKAMDTTGLTKPVVPGNK